MFDNKQIDPVGVIKNEFLNLKVNVFRNKKNGQMMVALPKKILKNIPNKMDIQLPIKYFKLKKMKGGKING